MNALVIISTLYTTGGLLQNGYTDVLKQTISKTNLSQVAFGTVLGENIGASFVALSLFFFAFSTILSWNLFGKINVDYLFKGKLNSIYNILALLFIFFRNSIL